MKIMFDDEGMYIRPESEKEIFQLGELRQKIELGTLCFINKPRMKKEKIAGLYFSKKDIEYVFMMQLKNADLPTFLDK